LASAHHRNERAGEADPARLPTPDDFQAMRDAYLATAPTPTAFDAVADKTSGLVHAFTGWSDEQLRGVDLPVLILVGDTDFIHVESAAEAMRLLPQGQLAVLPGTTHMGVTRSTLLAPIANLFLDDTYRTAGP
jgi:pimeloyl-ACP methyl ester carboxylesterase